MPSPVTVAFVELHPLDAARVLEHVPTAELGAFLAELPAAVAARALRNLTPFRAAECLERLKGEAAAMLPHLPTNVAAALLRQLDPIPRAEFVDALPRSMSIPLRLVLRYPEGTVGSILDQKVLTVYEDMTVADGIQLARGAPERLRKYLYVLDREQRLVGALKTHQCLTAKRTTVLRSLCDTEPAALRARSSLREAGSHEAWVRFNILPVVDRAQTFLGIVRRRRLEDALTGDEQAGSHMSLTDALVGFADLYWRCFADVFFVRRNAEPGGDP